MTHEHSLHGVIPGLLLLALLWERWAADKLGCTGPRGRCSKWSGRTSMVASRNTLGCPVLTALVWLHWSVVGRRPVLCVWGWGRAVRTVAGGVQAGGGPSCAAGEVRYW
jgi:hypothetical protein